MDGTPQAENQLHIITHPYHISPETLVEWAMEKVTPDEFEAVQDLGHYQAFGVMRGLKPLAVVIFNNYHPMKYGGDMRVIVVSDDPTWCRSGILRELFSYPFEQIGCSRITAVIRDGNKRSLKLCQGLGFKREGTLRRGHNGRTNAVVLSMLQHECKWLQDKPWLKKPEEHLNGQQVRQATTASARSNKNDRGTTSRQRKGDRNVGEGQRI
jgi:RimJ/RimL family protein N-acetyltransferase